MPTTTTAAHSSSTQFSTAPEVLVAAFRRHGEAAPMEDPQSFRFGPQNFLLSIGSERRWMNSDEVQSFLDELSFSIPLLQIRQGHEE